MNRFNRLLLIGVGISILLAFALGGLFQRSTSGALELAEAFGFRRMLTTQQGDQGAFRFFYVTNRKSQESSGPMLERFENQRAADLQFGFFDTKIQPSLGLGLLINPADWFQNEEIQLRDVRSLQQSEFIEQLRAQVDSSPYRSLLVNVNGFRERFPSALRKTAFLAHVLDIDSLPGPMRDALRRDVSACISRIIEHLNLYSVARIIQSAGGIDYALGDGGFVEHRQLHGHGGKRIKVGVGQGSNILSPCAPIDPDHPQSVYGVDNRQQPEHGVKPCQRPAEPRTANMRNLLKQSLHPIRV